MRKFLLFYFAFFTLTAVHSKSDSSYVELFPDKLNLRIYTKSGDGGFDLRDKNLKQNLRYAPNTSTRLGLGVNYRWFGLAMAVKTAPTEIEEKGDTKGLDLQGNVYKRRFVLDANYRRIEGFYLRNPKEIFGEWDSEILPQRSDARIRSMGISGYYIKNWRKFSYRSAFIFNERQVRSAGSLLFGAYYNRFRLDASHSLVPDNLEENFNKKLSLQSAEAKSMGISVGYVYSLVLGKAWFLNLSLVPGIGYSSFNGENENLEEISYDSSVSGKFDFRFALGRSGERYFWGFSGVFNNFAYSNDREVDFNFNYGNFRFTIGYRFHFNNKTVNKFIKY